jgi:large subunit ribosomal protein L18e
MRGRNPVLAEAVRALREAYRETKRRIWRELEARITRPRSRLAEMNLERLSRVAGDASVVVIPGKVLGSGFLERPLVVGALYFSKAASDKIAMAGGRALGLAEFVRSYKHEKGVRLLE